MANVIRRWNDPRHAVTLSGHTVERKDRIFLKSHDQWYPVLQTSMHFIYHDPTVARGSTLLCTCGAAGGVFDYQAYKKWNSYVGNQVISCSNFIQYGKHADGSHE